MPVSDDDLRRRRRALFVMLTVLGFREGPGRVAALPRAVSRWLGGWRGIGRIVVGMSRQGYDLVLTQYGAEGWRATFYPAGRAHSATRAAGTAWAPAPEAAVQQAAWETLRRAEIAA